MNLLSEPHDDFRKRVDVRLSSPEIHDARTQHVASIDDSIGYEGLTASLQPVEQRPVQCVKVLFDCRIADRLSQVGWNASERGPTLPSVMPRFAA